MDQRQVTNACVKYASKLISMGHSPVRDIEAPTLEKRLDHILWMCEQVPGMYEENVEKAMHWLGFMQGALMSMNVMTIDEMKEDNR